MRQRRELLCRANGAWSVYAVHVKLRRELGWCPAKAAAEARYKVQGQ